MRLKLTRNIGRDDLKKFGLVTEDKEIPSALATYSEGSVHDFEKDTGDELVKRGLAEADDGVDTRPVVRAVPARAAVAGVPKPETFADNPHHPGTKKDK
jgi:hypothetical protein